MADGRAAALCRSTADESSPQLGGGAGNRASPSPRCRRTIFVRMWPRRHNDVINSDYSWLTWGVSDVPHGRLSPEVLAAFAADRERARSLPVVVQAVPSGWSYDSSLRRHSAGDRTRLRAAWRRVTSFTAGRCQIYLEAFGGIGGGPGFGFRDVRIYVDGRLAGRAWKGGCSLGFGGGAGPAVAMLPRCLAISAWPNSPWFLFFSGSDPVPSSSVGGLGRLAR